jgi:membrane protein implicated in regulation of membrane protease activity
MLKQSLEDLAVSIVMSGPIVVVCLAAGWSWWATALAVAGFIAACYLLTHPMRRSLVEQRRDHEERMRRWRDIHGSG